MNAKLAKGEFLVGEDRQEQIYNMIAFWLSGSIYGIYVVLFFAAIFLLSRKKGKRNAVSMTFYVSMYIMFAMATTYSFINIYRFVKAYAAGEDYVQPIYYFRHWSSWDNYSFVIVVTSLILYADALVIYRCFIIWECSYYVVAVPTLLLAASIGINAVTVMWFARPTIMTFAQVKVFLNLIYPVNLAQNILTTGLIVWKIWRQHVMSRKSGLYAASSWNLLTILRILIESASVYTLQQIVLCVLYFLRHPAQVIIHATLIPSIGIVFALIAVRTHLAISEHGDDWPLKSSFMIPGWYEAEDDSAKYRPSSGSPVTPSSMQTNFPDLPYLSKDEEREIGVSRHRHNDLSFLEMLKEDVREKDVSDRSSSRLTT